MSSDSHSSEPVISVVNVGKCYHLYDRPQDRLKQAFWRGRRKYFTEFWALRDISFEMHQGEALGIIGRNGSGKSTLLQILSGTLAPSEGEVRIRGRIAALLELGSGFNPDFTGRENVYMNGAILGLPAKEMDARFDDIAAFADIGDFIEQPVKTYSSGMYVRLAFAVQVQVEPDILIVDEALAVGDTLFQKRCFQKMEELRTRGTTLLFVSHDQESVRTLTSRAILLKDGRAHSAGTSAEVILDYRRLLHEEEKEYFAVQAARAASRPTPTPSIATIGKPSLRGNKDDGGNGDSNDNSDDSYDSDKRSEKLSFGDFDAEITRVGIFDADGNECSAFQPGQKMIIRVTSTLAKDLTHLNVALRIRSKEGVKIYSWGTLNQDIAIWSGRARGEVFWDQSFRAGQELVVEFECDTPLGTNFYEVQVALSEENDRFYKAQRILHWRDEAAFFQVLMSAEEYFFGGVCDMRMRAHVRH